MSEPHAPEQVTVPVRGGELAALRWPGRTDDAPLAVLLHDLDANAMTWALVAAALTGVEVLAPDLRGRAASAGLPGPYGIEAHAEDVEVLLRAFGAGRRTVLAGHAMGAFVAAMAAAGDARSAVDGLVFVDGGAQLPAPPGADVDAMLAALLGPAADRFDRTFPDLAAVREFWAQHPAIGPWAGLPEVAGALARDMVPADGGLRCACVREALHLDAADMLTNERILEATDNLPVPATLLWAERGVLDERPGLYDDVRLAGLGLELQHITARGVPGTNHYSILWSPRGVAAVADAVRAAGTR